MLSLENQKSRLGLRRKKYNVKINIYNKKRKRIIKREIVKKRKKNVKKLRNDESG
jgi:hypothetical protein